MEVKAGYKQTEVGVIPEEWDVRPVGLMGEVVTGKALAVNGPGKQRPYLRTKNVFDGRIDISDVLTMPMTDDQFVQFGLRRGDVLLNEGQSLELVGRCAIYQGEYPEPCAIQNQLIRFRAKTGVSSIFASYVFRYCQQSGVFARIALQTTSIAHLGGSRFQQLLRAWPKTETEQHAIASALSDVDSLICSLDQLISKKRDIKQATMQQLLTGQTRLPGFHGKWEVKRLGELIVRLKKTIRPSSSGRSEGTYPFFTNTTKPVDRYLDEADFDTEAIIANTGGEAYFNYYNGSFAAMADCFVFETRLVTRFLYYFLKSVERAVNDNGFTGSGIKHLDKKYLNQMEVRCPSDLPEQTAIAEVLSDMDAEIAALEQRRDKTRDLKQGMMQELLTGRIRLL